MKRISLSVAAIVTILCASSVSFGQTLAGATAVKPAVYYEVFNQPDCPLNIIIDKERAGFIPSVPLLITNKHSTTVTAFVIHVHGDEQFNYNWIVFPSNKGLALEETREQIVTVSSYSENAPNRIISIDYVYFSDGKDWGPDSLGRSKAIKDFIKGHDLAIERLKSILLRKDRADFIEGVELYRFSGFGVPVSFASRMDFFEEGYKVVINALRGMAKRADEAKNLARKMEIMESTPSQ